MPTYQYACTECGDRSEVVQRFTDDPLTECALCGGKLRKVFSPVGIVFKGSGFYRTDSRNGSSTVSAAKDGAGKDGAGKDGASNGSGSSEGAKAGASESGAGASSSSSSSSDSSGSGSSSPAASSEKKSSVKTAAAS